MKLKENEKREGEIKKNMENLLSKTLIKK